ncbi:hypothetical protein ACWKSP_37850 [Micromonosporaceae bacterium Da 78-11]
MRLSPNYVFFGLVAFGLPIAVTVGWTLATPAPRPAAIEQHVGAGGVGGADGLGSAPRPESTKFAPATTMDPSSPPTAKPSLAAPTSPVALPPSSAAPTTVPTATPSAPSATPPRSHLPTLTMPPVPTPTEIDMPPDPMPTPSDWEDPRSYEPFDDRHGWWGRWR